jgi:hypothetical protein
MPPRTNRSIFISRWDKAITGKEPDGLKDQLGVAIANLVRNT